MIRPPKNPSRVGAQFNHVRDTAEHIKQRVQSLGNQTVTTQGTLPPMRKIEPIDTEQTDARWS